MYLKGVGDTSTVMCLWKQFLLPEIPTFSCQCGESCLTFKIKFK